MLLGVSDISGGGQLVRNCAPPATPKIPSARESCPTLCVLPSRPATCVHDRSHRSHAADHAVVSAVLVVRAIWGRAESRQAHAVV